MKPPSVLSLLVLTLVLTLGLASCAPVQPAAVPQAATQALAPAAETATAPAAAASSTQASSTTGAPVEIVFWRALGGAAGEGQEELVKRFNGSQNRIAVKSEFQGTYNDLTAKLLTGAAGGAGPDVTQLGTFEIRQFAKSGLLVDLKPYITGASPLDVSDWPQKMTQAGDIDGGTYWLPFNVSVPVLYYNTSAFEKAGLTAPPTTWTEFYEYARKLTLKDANGNVTQAGVALWNINWPLLSVFWSEGGSLNATDYSKVTFTDPVVVKVMTEFQNLIKEGAATYPDQASGGHRGAFENGQAAMILDSPAPFGDIFSKSVGFVPMVANFPAGAAGRVYAPGGAGISMLMTATPERRDAAWEFMKFMLSPESIAYYTEKSGYVAFTGSAQKAAASFLSDERYKIMHEAIPDLKGDFTVNMSPAIRNNFDAAMGKIFVEKADVQGTLAEAQAKAEKELKEETFTKIGQ